MKSNPYSEHTVRPGQKFFPPAVWIAALLLCFPAVALGAGGASSPAAAGRGHTAPPSATSTAGVKPAAGSAAAGAAGAAASSKGGGASKPTAITVGSDRFAVKVPEAYDLVWVTQGSDVSMPQVPMHGMVSIQAPGTGSAHVWALDSTTHKLASVSGSPGAAITVIQPADFKLDWAARLAVHLRDRAGKPLDYARVQVTDGSGRHMVQLLTPDSGGELVFPDVLTTGKVEIQAFRGDASTAISRSDLDKAGVNPEVTLTFADTAAALPVIGAAVAAAPPAHLRLAPRKSSSSGGPVDTMLFLSLLFLLALLYGGWVLSRNPAVRERAGEILKKLGIDVAGLGQESQSTPDAGAPAAKGGRAAAPNDPSTCPFCGTRKDPTTGSCACSLVPAGVVGKTVPEPATGLAPEPRLVTLDGPMRGQIFQLNGDTTIGRDANNTIALSGDTAASRRHARFTSSDGTTGQVEVVDEGSSNGTFVNGARVTRHTLQPADEIQIGHSRFRYEV